MADKIEYSKPVPPFVRFCAANIPMVFDDSLSYYEALCALWKWLQTDVIDVINNNAHVTQLWREELTTFENDVTDEIEKFEHDMRSDFHDLTELFNQLHDYVEHYFDNLDVQEEINNKLDELVSDGTIPAIMASLVDEEFATLNGTRVMADDYDTLEEAFAEANVSFGSIYLTPLKTYTVNTPIVLNHNVSIYGNGAKIVSNIASDYVITYKDPVSPNNWDLFEPYSIENLIFDCNETSTGAISIDRLHYAKLDNIKVTNNEGYAFKIKTVYWGTFENLHVQDCNGGGFEICGTSIVGGYTGANQNTYINCSVINYNNTSGFYGIYIKERSNQNNFEQITIQNSKTSSNTYGTGLYIVDCTNNTFYNLYCEDQEIDVEVETTGSLISCATFYNPYLGTDAPTKTCMIAKNSKVNVYNPYWYERELQAGYNKSLFVSHHDSGKTSYVYLETDLQLTNANNHLLCYYNGADSTYTDYKAVAPTSGNFGIVLSKAAYNENTMNIIFRSSVNPLYVDNMKVTSETTKNYLQVYRWGMFGNQNATYAFQPTLFGNLGQLPTDPVNGLSYFEINNYKLLTYYNGTWYYADGTPYTPSP